MKSVLLLTSFLVLVGLNSFITVYAQDTSSEVDEKAVDAKCYVELIGGKDTISLWLVKPSQLKALASTIIGQEILLTPQHQQAYKNKIATIYKTKQCVLEEDDFTSPRARIMDKNFLR